MTLNSSYTQEFSCDYCGHFSNDHEDRASDGTPAMCKKCDCVDFESEAADKNEVGGLAGRVDLAKLERLLDTPGQDLTGFVPALIERVRDAEAALEFAQVANRLVAAHAFGLKEAAIQLDQWLEVQAAVQPTSKKVHDAWADLRAALDRMAAL